MTDFINEETKSFLARLKGSDVDTQLQNIRERIELESKDLTEIINKEESDRLELVKEIGDLRLLMIEDLDAQMRTNTAHKEAIEDLQIKLNRAIMALVAGGIIGVLCLVKSLI